MCHFLLSCLSYARICRSRASATRGGAEAQQQHHLPGSGGASGVHSGPVPSCADEYLAQGPQVGGTRPRSRLFGSAGPDGQQGYCADRRSRSKSPRWVELPSCLWIPWNHCTLILKVAMWLLWKPCFLVWTFNLMQVSGWCRLWISLFLASTSACLPILMQLPGYV